MSPRSSRSRQDAPVLRAGNFIGDGHVDELKRVRLDRSWFKMEHGGTRRPPRKFGQRRILEKTAGDVCNLFFT
jgi:hypothetical protein